MTPYQQAIQNINKKYADSHPESAPAKPDFLTKVGNAGSNVANNIFNAVTAPFQKIIGSGVRAIQSIPEILKGPKNNAKIGEIQDKPFTSPTGFKSDTLSGSTIPQNLGSAAQAASFLAPETSLGKYGATGFLQGAGTELQNPNTTPERVAGAGAGGAIADVGLQFGLNKINDFATNHPIFQNPTLAQATAERGQAATQGVNALNQMSEQVGQFKSDLGTNFEQGAQQIAQTNPNLKLSLSNKQLESLNSLKESKLFTLPDNLDNTTNNVSVGGSKINIGNPKIASQLEGIQNEAATSLDPMQAQDLIRRLNKLTFAAKASGDLAVNQQTIGLTNEIKQAASQTFGPEWNNVYSSYAKGINAVESLNDIVNLDPNATPTDVNNSLNKLLKLGKTPEGKIILQQAVDEFKSTSGIDLTDPVKATHQILDKQIALEEAQKAVAAKTAAKKGMGRYLEKRAIGTIAVGAASTVFLYPLLKQIKDALQGK